MKNQRKNQSCWGFWRRYYYVFNVVIRTSILMANSCDTAASTFGCLFPLVIILLSFKPVFCYHEACAMDELHLSHPDLWPSQLSIPGFSPAPALLVSKKSALDLGQGGGCQMSLTRTVFPLYGAEAVSADDPTSRCSLYRTLSPQYWRPVGRLLNVFRFYLSLSLFRGKFHVGNLGRLDMAHILGFHDPEG